MKDRVIGEIGRQEGEGLGRPLATSVFLLLSTNVTEDRVLSFFEDNCYVPLNLCVGPYKVDSPSFRGKAPRKQTAFKAAVLVH